MNTKIDNTFVTVLVLTVVKKTVELNLKSSYSEYEEENEVRIQVTVPMPKTKEPGYITLLKTEASMRGESSDEMYVHVSQSLHRSLIRNS